MSIWAIIPCSPNVVTVHVCSKLKTNQKSVVFTNKAGKNSRYFVEVFNKTIISLAFVGYEMIIVNSAPCASWLPTISYPTRTCGIIVNYYSFKIFPRFWLVKITRIIHHNQLPLTKFGKNFVIVNQWRQKCSQVADYWTVNRETFYSFHGEILSKNMARTARRQLDARWTTSGIWSIFADLNRTLSP